MVDHDEEMTLEPPRKRHEVQEVTMKLSGKRRKVEKKKHGGWSQKGKRRCRRPESLRMRSKAPAWTSNGEGHHGGVQVPKITEVKVACQERKVKTLRARSGK